jgi:hypothetical protein
MFDQSQCGSGCLDPLGDQLQAERFREPDDGANDGQIAGVGAQVAHELRGKFFRHAT